MFTTREPLLRFRNEEEEEEEGKEEEGKDARD
jgi:hypothetical protein